jgi:hypothetical protein
MDGKALIEYLNRPAKYPHNVTRRDLGPDPVCFADVLEASLHVSRAVCQRP